MSTEAPWAEQPVRFPALRYVALPDTGTLNTWVVFDLEIWEVVSFGSSTAPRWYNRRRKAERVASELNRLAVVSESPT